MLDTFPVNLGVGGLKDVGGAGGWQELLMWRA